MRLMMSRRDGAIVRMGVYLIRIVRIALKTVISSVWHGRLPSATRRLDARHWWLLLLLLLLLLRFY